MFEIGELVKWYETYGDVLITKDTGLGVVIQRFEQDYGFSDGPWVTYKVFRAKYGDTMIFEREFLEKNESFSNGT